MSRGGKERERKRERRRGEERGFMGENESGESGTFLLWPRWHRVSGEMSEGEMERGSRDGG